MKVHLAHRLGVWLMISYSHCTWASTMEQEPLLRSSVHQAWPWPSWNENTCDCLYETLTSLGLLVLCHVETEDGEGHWRLPWDSFCTPTSCSCRWCFPAHVVIGDARVHSRWKAVQRWGPSLHFFGGYLAWVGLLVLRLFCGLPHSSKYPLHLTSLSNPSKMIDPPF